MEEGDTHSGWERDAKAEASECLEVAMYTAATVGGQSTFA